MPLDLPDGFPPDFQSQSQFLSGGNESGRLQGGELLVPQFLQPNVAMAKVAIENIMGKSSKELFQSSRIMFHGYVLSKSQILILPPKD